MKLTLPIPIKISTNKIYAGVHWSVRKEYATLYHLLSRGQPKYIGKYPIQIAYRFTWQKHALDATNCSFLVKLLEDGLVIGGAIKGDDYMTVRRTIIESKRDRKIKEDFVEIEIEYWGYELSPTE